MFSTKLLNYFFRCNLVSSRSSIIQMDMENFCIHVVLDHKRKEAVNKKRAGEAASVVDGLQEAAQVHKEAAEVHIEVAEDHTDAADENKEYLAKNLPRSNELINKTPITRIYS